MMPQFDHDFYAVVAQDKQNLDCLILESTPQLPRLIKWLQAQAILLPTVLLQADEPPSLLYHSAEVRLPTWQLANLVEAIDQAITAFLDLSPACLLASPAPALDATVHLTTQNFLMRQQRRLTQKLKERLGYLGVYYKRDDKNFFRYLPSDEQAQFIEQLKTDYREIILRYFLEDNLLNQKIDDLVNMAFFADISVAQIVEIHMQLMDEFSKQLKLEGRSEEVLLDYRLTLIDTIAHLCEMYRRSIPRQG